MGGIVSSLFGGSKSKSTGNTASNAVQQSTSQNLGFSGLPTAIQNAFTNLATTSNNLLNPGGNPNSSLFLLPSLSQPTQSALSSIQNQNFAITPDSITSDIAMQMNPYNQDVINQIENAQNGTESQLNQYLTEAGQFGSNRGMLGASDISQQGANQIGSFLANQFNTALQNALTTIPQNLAQSAQGAVQAGQLTQQQQLQNQQAPLSALAALAQITGTLPTTSNQGYTQSTGTSTSQGNNLSTSNANNGVFAPIGGK